MLKNFLRWSNEDVEAQQGKLKEFLSFLQKKGMASVEEHLDQFPPYFVIPLNLTEATPELEEKPIPPVSGAVALDPMAGKTPTPIVSMPQGVRVSYVMGALTARLVGENGRPMSTGIHLHSQRFDSKRGITVEKFDMPAEELNSLVGRIQTAAAETAQELEKKDKDND